MANHSQISISEKPKYFFQGDWTGQITLIRLDKSDFSRNAPRALAQESGAARPRKSVRNRCPEEAQPIAKPLML
jgi:hypothetical protein